MAGLPSRPLLVTLLAWPLAASVNPSDTCYGYEEAWAVCNGLPACSIGTPVDCTFSEWTAWVYFGGCTELCSRTRTIDQNNNEFGKPCSGSERETKPCNPVDYNEKSCAVFNQSCTFHEWQDWWSDCSDEKAQQTRSRDIKSQPKGLTKDYCIGSTEETKPCASSDLPRDCQLTEWVVWSACDKTCGGGYQTRSRSILTEAGHGGTCPSQALAELQPCNEAKCVLDADCALSTWSSWTEGPKTQLSRHRKITVDAVAQGKSCDGHLLEIKPLPKAGAEDCSFSEWEPWTNCTKTCGGGQMSRSRSMKAWLGTGSCNLRVTAEQQGCNKQVCGSQCTYSTWGAWSNCSNDVECGTGSMTRDRSVSVVGANCDGAITQAAPCRGTGPNCDEVKTRSPCDVVHLADSQDCAWGLWKEWGACSLSCGGGVTQRSRMVLTAAGTHGQPCAVQSMSEAKPCNSAKCHPCVNGAWEEWQVWTNCTTACDEGIQSRSRKVKTEANYCGHPATGDESEYRTCDTGKQCVADVNCMLAQWGAWSSCTPACFGVSERTRAVEVKASGKGTACTDSTKEVTPCNPGPNQDVPESCLPKDTKDCKLSEWSVWSACTAACSGVQHRLRHIIQLPMRGASCVNQSLTQGRGCSTVACIPTSCIDCQWGAWNDWGVCAQCNGQRTRMRSIQETANYCGTPCEKRTVQETEQCKGFCETEKYCVWQDWAISTSCPMPSKQNCGALTYRRSRSMKIIGALEAAMGKAVPLAKGDSNLACTGYETATDKCRDIVSCDADKTTCPPVDCSFGPWREWSAPTCTGVCERQRSIGNAAKCGGGQCLGTIVETKACMETTCEVAVDCILSEWSFWTPCGSDPTEQTSKSRTVLSEPRFGGKLCPDKAALKVTRGCWEQAPTDCKFAAWSIWEGCSKTCDSGTTKRRRVFETAVEDGGVPCNGHKEEIGECNQHPCPYPATAVDCVWQKWSEWTCGTKIKGMMSRNRIHIWPLNAALLKKACVGESEQIKPCDEGYTLPDWGEWTKCDKQCGSGQKTRIRGDMIPPANGVVDNSAKDAANKQSIMPKPVSLQDTIGCNEAVCHPLESVNCSFTSWEAWTPCDSTCGPGQQKRLRTHMTLRHEFGYGCEEKLEETRACTTSQQCKIAIDCAWSLWAQWSICNAECGGGEKIRVRGVLTSPLNGGKQCEPLTKEEAVPCNVQSCNLEVCQDAAWEEWEDWTPCSLTCNPVDGNVGLQSRTRDFTPANSCGKSLVGVKQETRQCNEAQCPSQDCTWNAWSLWSGCSKPGQAMQTCGGSQTRKRSVAQIGDGPVGQQCEGVTEQMKGCKTCDAVNPVDCQFSEWVAFGGVPEYGGCTMSCGGGRKIKKRHIAVLAVNGGKACEGALEATTACNTKSCENEAPVDCAWGVWSGWGSCDVCGHTGQRTRSRLITQNSVNGGKNCTAGDSIQLEPCQTPCEKTYCIWGSWAEWGGCNANCGHAQKSRRRYLEASTNSSNADDLPPVQADFARKYSELEAHIQAVNSAQLRDLCGAFAFGGIAFLVALAALRLSTNMRATRNTSGMSAYSMLDVTCSDDTLSTARQLHPPATRTVSNCLDADVELSVPRAAAEHALGFGILRDEEGYAAARNDCLE